MKLFSHEETNIQTIHSRKSRASPAGGPLDPTRDNVEEPQRGIDYGESYPLTDTTVLYYWRETYWRRLAS